MTSVVRSLALFAVGIIGLAVGVGLGLPHLAKTGFSIATLVGIALFIGGLGAALVGGTGVVRGTPGWWRVLAVPALLFSTVVALYALGQAVAFTNVAPTALGDASPADRGMSYRDVEFPSSDGVTLSGWYVPSTNGAGVALLHGSGSTRSSVLDHAVVLARHGYGVLLYDARGHGRSAGRAMDAGWWGDEDLAGAVAFLAAQADIEDGRIAVVGMSLGGEVAVGAAASDHRIRAVVAEGIGQRVAADKEWQSQEFGARGWVQEQIDRLTYALVDLLSDAEPPRSLRDSIARTAPRPVLLIAGGAAGDETTVANFHAGGSPNATVWTVVGSGHTDGLATDPVAWETRVVDFVAAAIGE